MTATATVTRFAPSPSGPLHIGHAHAALFAAAAGERFLLRIEDIDGERSRPEHARAILEDLAWLGLAWEAPVLYQSTRLGAYEAALAQLDAMGLLYPCFCTRAQVAAEIERAARAPHGPEGALYPGTCRDRGAEDRHARIAAGEPHALRLDMGRAASLAGPLTWHDAEHGEVEAEPESLGDVVLARKGLRTSYHLAVTVDDAHQGITLVTRGADLFHATHVHRLLQALLDMPVPRWHHHRLISDSAGRRLAKRDAATSLATLRAAGHTPAAVRAMAGFP